MFNEIIYITGPDGSGKTTLLLDLEKKIIKDNKKANHIWIRSPKILSKPLMAYCRLIGLTTYKTIDGIKYGKHEFYKSNFVSWLFPILQLIDFKIEWFFEKRKIKSDEIVLFDRFSIDTLADLMVDTKRMNLHKTRIGRALINMIPNNTKILISKVDEGIIRKRKLDTLYDELLASKIIVYNRLSLDLNIKIVDNNRNYKEVREDIFKYFGFIEK